MDGDQKRVKIHCVASSESSDEPEGPAEPGQALNKGVFTALKYWSSRKEMWEKALKTKFTGKRRRRRRRTGGAAAQGPP